MKMTAALRLVVKSVYRRLFPAFVAATMLDCLSSHAAAAATGVTVVHTFSAPEFTFPALVNADGSSPQVSMILGDDGNLYGTTSTGGINGAGNIFNLSPAGTLTDLCDFQQFTDTNNQTFYDFGPNQLAAGPHGSFYGSTQRGGTNHNGTLFKLTSTGNYVELYVFSAQGTDASATNSDGFSPTGALVLGTNGNFFGTTQYGGSNGNGTIFQVTPTGDFTSVYSFSSLDLATFTDNADGATPNGLTLGTDGNFYGTTQTGGANGLGEFFQYSITGGMTPLYSFGASDNDAAYPQAVLVQGPNGNFYGTSAFGGSALSGTIFEVTPDGMLTVLHSFSGGADGGSPAPP